MKKYNRNQLHAQIDEALTYDDINIVPRASDIASRQDIPTITRLVGDIMLENPVIPANMDSITDIDMMIAAAEAGSIAFLHRFMPIADTLEKIERFYHFAHAADGLMTDRPLGISVGTSENELKRAYETIKLFKCMAVIDDPTIGKVSTPARLVLLIDAAHGDHTQVCQTVRDIHEIIRKMQLEGRVFIIAGNIATYEAAGRLINAGADGLKVGVGNGSLCETRIRTGAGVPQVSAIGEVVRARDDFYDTFTGNTQWITIIADGGVKYPGDIVKALWLGADTVMSGYLFAGTDETPGDAMKKGLFPNEREFKIYRGSASVSSKNDRGETANVEGNIKEVPAKGPVAYIFQQIKEGVQSGLSYAGSLNFDELRATTYVVRITNNGVLEARPNFIER